MDFSRGILKWYDKNKRDLPWRNTKDPYLVWVSEIILQQTRVGQGLSYYERFVEQFPDIEALSIAEEDDVMKAWQGLGYYSRARNMHQAAKEIHRENKAKFPVSYDEIIRMHGVGDYSASAIASIVYGEPRPVVDGNVLRVIGRYSGIKEPINTNAGKKKVKEILTHLIDPNRPGDFNQAMMELGALVCKPKQPLCIQCPLSQGCYAFLNNMTANLPNVNKIKSSRTRYFNYLVIINQEDGNNFIWMKKRKEDDIWKNLYDFPLIESDSELSINTLRKNPKLKSLTGSKRFKLAMEEEKISHILSHQELRIKFFLLSMNHFSHPDYQKINILDLKKYAVPKPIENFLKKVAYRPGIFSIFPD